MFDFDLFDSVIIWKSKRTDFAKVISEYPNSKKKSDQALVQTLGLNHFAGMLALPGCMGDCGRSNQVMV